VKLGLFLNYWSARPPAGALEQVRTADRLGFDSVWSSEAYGSDALTPLAWWGAHTEQIKLGTAIMQMAARTPAATAMAAMSMDHLTGGRFVLGLGVSGPQVVEGWYGQPYARPLARTREYVAIVRRVIAREEPVAFDGEFYPLPYPDGTGLGKPLKSTVHPLRADLPIFLAAEGPRNVSLAAEIADGWLPFWFSPRSDGFYRAALQEGFDREDARRSWEDFEIPCVVPVVPNPDVEAAADMIRPLVALYVGGMGSRERNFHKDVFVRMGFESAADRIQVLYLAGNREAAIAAVPQEMVEAVALIGSPAKIRDDLERWRESVITTLCVQGPPPLLEMVADLVG
jgi:F420-dependent oxidoreductase-like protein